MNLTNRAARCSFNVRATGLFVIPFALLVGAGIRSAHADPAADTIFDGSFEVVPNAVYLGPTACQASGSGHDYQVGPGSGQLASIDQVPWENLGAGDTVRIFYRAQPYKGKFAINAHGTAAAPVRVCGVKGPAGQRPVIDGADATSRPTMNYGRNSASATNQQRGVVMIVARGSEDGVDQPTYVQIDGLKLQGGHPTHGFTDMSGTRQTYMAFGACVWVERGHHVLIADNEITDCSQAVFSRSQDGAAAYQTRDLRLAGNDMYDNGVAGSDGIHTTYIQSVGVTYEFNRFGPQKAGAEGNSIKDRSVGSVVRYNRIEGGTYAIDLVDAEDYTDIALADPAYHLAYVYGNQIIKYGSLMLHYGGDHGGSEANYRKGTVYFYNNTVHMLGEDGIGAYLFRLSTTQETGQIWNNVFIYDGNIDYPSMRTGQDVTAPYVSGGIVNLGVSWIDHRWADSDPWHPVSGELNGASNLLIGSGSPVDATTLIPTTGGGALDAAEAQLGAVAAYPVTYQLEATSLTPQPRETHGAGMDLGAIER